MGSSCLQLEVSDLLEGDVVKIPRKTNIPELMEYMMLIGSSQVDCGSRTWCKIHGSVSTLRSVDVDVAGEIMEVEEVGDVGVRADDRVVEGEPEFDILRIRQNFELG